MKKYIIFAIITGVLFSCQKQPFEPDCKSSVKESDSTSNNNYNDKKFVKNYGASGEEIANSIIKTPDGGYAFLGTSIVVYPDFYLVKTDRYGNLQWQKTYGEPNNISKGHCVRLTTDDGFVLIGSDGGENGYTKVINTDSCGSVLWQTSPGELNSYNGNSIALSGDNGYVGIGTESKNGGGIVVFKLNSSGQLLWSKLIDPEHASEGRSIERTMDNGFIIAGNKLVKSNGFSKNNLYLVKINSQGDVEWERTWKKGFLAFGNYAKQTRDGGYICVGNKYKEKIDKYQIYVIKVDSKGRYEWIKGYYPSEGWTAGDKLVELPDGNFVIGGEVNFKPTILKITSNGSIIWKRTFDSNIISNITDLIIASDGGFAIAGEVFMPLGDDGFQAVLMKTDKNGEL